MSRIEHHAILGDLEDAKQVWITVDGQRIPAREGRADPVRPAGQRDQSTEHQRKAS